MDKNQEKDFLLLRNLKDAGCNAEQIEKFLQLRQTGKTSGQLRILSQQRELLLENLHESQQKIDSLDHLLYFMKTNLSGRKNETYGNIRTGGSNAVRRQPSGTDRKDNNHEQ
ncbi:MAG: hypothetical protein ACI4UV_00790 [Victivallales bacterium]